MAEQLYAIGKIVRARGVRGEVAVEPLTDVADRFHKLEKVYLGDGTAVETAVKSARSSGRLVLMRFEGIETRTAAERLIGKFVSVAEADLVQLPPDTYFQFEIVGMHVYTEDDRLLGTIAEVIAMPAHDVWRVEGAKEFLLPATKNLIVNVDRAAGKVTIRLLEGLLEL